MKIALTGHRPERLGLPENVAAPEWEDIRNWIRSQLIELKADQVYVGMAAGSDMALGYVAAQLKQEGFPIKITCVLPCTGYGSTTPNYEFVYFRANEVVTMEKKWMPDCDNKRDQYMADHCDVMLSIFDGHKKGGVWSTIKKTRRQEKRIYFCPAELLNPDVYKEDI